MNTTDHIKQPVKDKVIDSIANSEDMTQHEFVHVYAVSKTFLNVVFKQCNFLSCYFRNCRFVQCDFTGCLFKECNLKGSQFENCMFKFSTWDKTIVDEEVLNCLPSEENLARDFVRSLRISFAQTGNHEAVNKAAKIEVQLAGAHLYKAAYSREGYYRQKYTGLNRFLVVLGHCKWKFLDLLWGNGESIIKTVISGFMVSIVSVVIMHCLYPDRTVFENSTATLAAFWGVKTEHNIYPLFSITLTVIRYFLFGLFMAILIKKLSRR